MPTPEPIPGAPPYVVWIIGVGLIILALAIAGSIIAIAVWLANEARDRGLPGWLFLIIGLIGGWLAAVIWLMIRDRWDPAIDLPDSIDVKTTDRAHRN